MWGWLTAINNMRSRRCRCRSSGTTSTRWSAAAGRSTPRPGPTGPGRDGSRAGRVGYGPNLATFAVYLMVVQFLPAHRVVALLESLTGAAPSVGSVHGMLTRTAGQLAVVHDRIRALV